MTGLGYLNGGRIHHGVRSYPHQPGDMKRSNEVTNEHALVTRTVHTTASSTVVPVRNHSSDAEAIIVAVVATVMAATVLSTIAILAVVIDD